jgi:transcriptional regulator with XRE-family HTH domain
MKERILEFLKAENKSSAQFAEEIGVQPSGISHILSGRNNPSLDFVIKMLEKYNYLSVEWLLFGRGGMYTGNNTPDLFNLNSEAAVSSSKSEEITSETVKSTDKEHIVHKFSNDDNDKIVRIVWFYSNNSFKEFYPVK